MNTVRHLWHSAVEKDWKLTRVWSSAREKWIVIPCSARWTRRRWVDLFDIAKQSNTTQDPVFRNVIRGEFQHCDEMHICSHRFLVHWTQVRVGCSNDLIVSFASRWEWIEAWLSSSLLGVQRSRLLLDHARINRKYVNDWHGNMNDFVLRFMQPTVLSIPTSSFQIEAIDIDTLRRIRYVASGTLPIRLTSAGASRMSSLYNRSTVLSIITVSSDHPLCVRVTSWRIAVRNPVQEEKHRACPAELNGRMSLPLGLKNPVIQKHFGRPR